MFSGAVLDPSDKRLNGVVSRKTVKAQIPEQFWKIVVAKSQNGPKAFGFLLKQQLTSVSLEFAVPEDWESYQTPIAELKELMCGLATFDLCREHDILVTEEIQKQFRRCPHFHRFAGVCDR